MEDQYYTYQPTNLSSPIPSDEADMDYCEIVEKDGRKQHSCTYPNCGKIFKFKSEIMRHRIIHFNNRPYTCTYEGCNKTFKRPDALENHLRIHTKDKPFVCEAPRCGLSFTTKSGLRYHMLKHKEQKRYECTFPGCDKSFLTLAQLKQHNRAVNMHQKLLSHKGSDDSLDIVKREEKSEEDYGDYYSQKPRPAKIVEWQVRNQEEEEERPENERKQEEFETIIKVVLSENKVLKHKLDMCSKLIGGMPTKTEIYQPAPEPSTEPSMFFSENQFDFISYLREKDSSSY